MKSYSLIQIACGDVGLYIVIPGMKILKITTMTFLIYFILLSLVKGNDSEGNDKEFEPYEPGNKGRITEIAELEFEINGSPIGMIQIGLFGEIAPKTVENFSKLCNGWKNDKGVFYSYTGSRVHEISFFYRIGLGDITSGVGSQSIDTGGISIYGKGSN